MMKTNQSLSIIDDTSTLLKITMKMYWDYLSALEGLVKRVPQSEEGMIQELYEHIEEVQSAMNHDVNVFEKAMQSDVENIHGIQDQLKINNIRNTLSS